MSVRRTQYVHRNSKKEKSECEAKSMMNLSPPVVTCRSPEASPRVQSSAHTGVHLPWELGIHSMCLWFVVSCWFESSPGCDTSLRVFIYEFSCSLNVKKNTDRTRNWFRKSLSIFIPTLWRWWGVQGSLLPRIWCYINSRSIGATQLKHKITCKCCTTQFRQIFLGQ